MKQLKLIFLVTLFPFLGMAQADLQGRLPEDAAVRTGKLRNGMTYYIRHNGNPAGHADFEIVHAVGALQENAEQNGLAHFLEHLAFNGLKHFPGKSMLDYMEGIGVKFGLNVNAATAQEYTRYVLRDVPLPREGIVDTCLLVLADWSGSILCEQEEIDAERGVIEGEWRSRSGFRSRKGDALAPAIYNHSKYAVHNVIGDMDIVRNFKREELLDFYRKWYHPAMQAVVIVGDFDVDRMEEKVRKTLGALPGKKDPAPKEVCRVPDNRELLYGTYCDSEATSSYIELLFKHGAVSPERMCIGSEYVKGYEKYLVCSLMNGRFNDILAEGELPLSALTSSYGKLAGDRDVFSLSGEVGKGTRLLDGLDLMLRECERFRRHGFTAGELERLKADAGRALERQLQEKDNAKNGSYVQSCFNHFIYRMPMLETETYCRLLRSALDSFTLEKADRIARSLFRKDNVVVTVVTPEKEADAIPSRETVAGRLEGAAGLEVGPYAEKTVDTTRFHCHETPGKVVSEKVMGLGITEWILSNGIKVYLLPTDCSKDEIEMTAVRDGGLSLAGDEDFCTARMLSGSIATARLASLSVAERERLLAGRIVYVTPFVSEYQQSFDCSSTPADYEMMLNVVRLYFSDMEFDRGAVERNIRRNRENLVSRKAVPFSYLQDTVTAIRSGFHPRGSSLILRPEDMDRVDFSRLAPLYRRLYGNPADFTFYFTGAIDLEKFRPSVEKYLGCLKTSGERLDWKDVGIRPPKGHVDCDFSRPMENPAATVFVEYTDSCSYGPRLAAELRLLQGILDIRYTQVIREERGGTYTVDLECGMRRQPVPVKNLIVSFQSRPGQMDELKPLIGRELERLVREGIDPADFNKSKEYMLKMLEQSVKSNMYWQSVMVNYIRYGEDIHTGRRRILESITPEDIRRLLEEFLEADNVVSVVLRPE